MLPLGMNVWSRAKILAVECEHKQQGQAIHAMYGVPNMHSKPYLQ